jgi:hypothetical protein
MGSTQAESVGEQCAEEDVRAQEEGDDRRLKKTA